MKPLKPIILGALVLSIAFAIYSVFFPPAEKVIGKRLSGLAAAISSRPGGNIAMVANVSKIGSYFHPEVRIALEGFGREVASVNGRGDLEQAALAARNTAGRISVKFYNVAVIVQPTGTNAVVTLTALVNLNDQPDPAMQELQFDFEKAGRQWLVRTVKPGSRPSNLKFTP